MNIFPPVVPPLADMVWLQYDEMYQRSIQDPNGFWADMAKEFTWAQQVCSHHLHHRACRSFC
jgi:hypothetical protein